MAQFLPLGHDASQPSLHRSRQLPANAFGVVLAHFGIDAGSYSFPYVARWAEDKTVFKRNLDEVQKVSAQLIEGIDGAGLGE